MEPLHMPKKTIHTGIITDNLDPEKRGRLSVECPTIVSGDTIEWAEPKFFFIDSSKSAGSFFIPNIGSQVEVEIEDEEDSEVNGLEAKWMCAVYPFGSVPEEFKTNYPERRGWKTSAGHVFYFDDTNDDMTFQYTHPSGTEIKVDHDGNVFLNTATDKSVLVGSDTASDCEFIVRGDTLETFLNDLKSWLDGHTHKAYSGTGQPSLLDSLGGPVTGTTAGPGTSSTTIPSDLLSDDHKVK